MTRCKIFDSPITLFKLDLPTSCPTLDWLIKQGTPRELWAVEWIRHNWVLGIPDEIDPETLAEIVPEEIRDEVELYFMTPAGGVQ
jgi:hypothetical protein